MTIFWYLANNYLEYTSHALSKDNDRDDLEIYIHRQTTTPPEISRMKPKDMQNTTSVQVLSMKLKNRQSTTNIKIEVEKQEQCHKYQVNLPIVWYLADNNLAYASYISSRNDDEHDLETYV